jgi:ABC-type Fe3+/spermidine/putrescine transport system ATPase subunit
MVGPSGSGKTTLLDMLAGKKTADYTGEVGRCRLTVSKPELKARPVSALETRM